MFKPLLISLAFAIGFGSVAASAGPNDDDVRRAFLKNRQIKWQTVRADAPHALTGPATSAEREREPRLRVAPRARLVGTRS